MLKPEEVEGLTVIYPYFQELDNDTNKKWVAAWRQRFGADYPYITNSANTVWNGWHLWAMAANKAGSASRPRSLRRWRADYPSTRQRAQ